MSPLADAIVGASRRPLAQGADGVWHTDRAAVGGSYSDEALDVLSDHSGASWWNEQRVRWARATLGGHGVSALLDVGAGNGAVATRLRESGVDVVGLEPLPRGCARMAAAGVPAVSATLGDLGLDATVPAIGYFDVLEHLEDPVGELRAAHAALVTGGLLLVTVPAYPALWGAEDDAAGHLRRYTAASLRREAGAAGFVAERVEHLFAALVLPALVVRRLPRRAAVDDDGALDRLAAQLDPPVLLARIADAWMRLEHALARWYPLPVGLSVAGVFRKR